MKPDIGIKSGSREQIAALLQQLLADQSALAALTRDAHWNITGISFASLHELFGQQYAQLNEQIDETAERIRTLGLPVKGQLAELAGMSRLSQAKQTGGKARQLISGLLEAHESIIGYLRKAVEETARLNDAGTSDFLTGLMEAHEKTAWMLRSSLE